MTIVERQGEWLYQKENDVSYEQRSCAKKMNYEGEEKKNGVEEAASVVSRDVKTSRAAATIYSQSRISDLSMQIEKREESWLTFPSPKVFFILSLPSFLASSLRSFSPSTPVSSRAFFRFCCISSSFSLSPPRPHHSGWRAVTISCADSLS